MTKEDGEGTGPIKGRVVQLDGVPHHLILRFEKSANEGETLVVGGAADILVDGTYGTSWLLAGRDRIWVVTPSNNGAEDSFAEWPTCELTEAKVSGHVGASTLDADIDGHRVELIRFSNGRQRVFHRIAKHLESLGEEGQAATLGADDGLAYYCDSCGRLLPERGGICPVCLKKGQVLLRLIRYLGPHRAKAAVMVSLMSVIAVLELAPTYLTTKVLIDDLLLSGDVDTITLIPGIVELNVESYGWSRLTWLGLLVCSIVGIRLVLIVVNIFQGRIGAALGLGVTHDIRTSLYHHLQRLSLSYYDRMRVGTLISRVLSDASQVNGFLVDGVPQFGITILKLLGLGVILFLLDPVLAAWSLITIPAVIVLSRYFGKKIYPLYHRVSTRRSRLSGTVNDSLSGIRVVKAFGQESQENDKFGVRNDDLFAASLKAEQTWATMFPWIAFLSTAGAYAVYFLGGTSVVTGAMTIGTLMAFIGYLTQFYGPIRWLTNINRWLTSQLASTERIFEVLDTRPEIVDTPDSEELTSIKGEVRLENLSFGYDPLVQVLKSINIDIAPGEMVGLVGRSGAGKTTIINMICRFYDPQEGRVTIDGKDLKDISMKSWHSFLGIVPQESFLFFGTIADNIAYAKVNAHRDDVIRAAQAANAHNFIMRFPDGYDTMVGERGVRLSGGERQRVAIARAILHDPKVLILDEATSSLDTETEQLIQEALERLVKNRTVFAIAHRLSTLRNASRLLVIDDGEVVEFGSHNELLEMDGVYATLFRAQQELSAIKAIGE